MGTRSFYYCLCYQVFLLKFVVIKTLTRGSVYHVTALVKLRPSSWEPTGTGAADPVLGPCLQAPGGTRLQWPQKRVGTSTKGSEIPTLQCTLSGTRDHTPHRGGAEGRAGGEVTTHTQVTRWEREAQPRPRAQLRQSAGETVCRRERQQGARLPVTAVTGPGAMRAV